MNYITLILGARGTGKSYYTINEIILKHPKKVLIVDRLDHPSYRAQGFQIVDIDSLSRWKSGVKRITVNAVSIKEDLRKLCWSISNCLLIFEDATKYFRTNAPVELYNLIYDSKQKTHGRFCLGCCWTLMLVMFAFGSVNLGWMLLLGIVMAAEKSGRWGRFLTRPIGLGLIAGAIFYLISAMPFIIIS